MFSIPFMKWEAVFHFRILTNPHRIIKLDAIRNSLILRYNQATTSKRRVL